MKIVILIAPNPRDMPWPCHDNKTCPVRGRVFLAADVYWRQRRVSFQLVQRWELQRGYTDGADYRVWVGPFCWHSFEKRKDWK